MSEKLDEVKTLANTLRKNLSKRQREALADYFKSFVTSESSDEIDENLDPLDKDYLAMKRDEDALRKRNEAVKVLKQLGEKALLLALKI